MAKVKIRNILVVSFNGFTVERGCDSTGPLALHPDIVREYEERGFNSLPKSEAEMKQRGASSFNALSVSLVNLHVYPTGQGNLVSGDLFPMRYSFTTAVQELIKSEKMSLAEATEHNPRQLNTSLLVVIKKADKFYLLCRRKGKGVLGEGQLHASLYGGRVDADLIGEKNPLYAALKKHLGNEIGLDINRFPGLSPKIMVDEPDVGMVNFGFIVKSDEASIFNAYRQSSAKNESPKVASLALLPISDLPEIHLVNGKQMIRDVLTYAPAGDELAEQIETSMEIRPYTKAIMDFVRESNIRYLIKAAGF